jgi:asparagine synthase (glutamine-hydrolysing)
MCGINGIFAYHSAAPAIDRQELLRTRDRMSQRGPDGSGEWISPESRVGLGHRRLAIIDLSEMGLQPMATEDGKLRIVFNGEIYNYQQLRQYLQDKGTHFRSQSDTEVLLHLYREFGAEMVHRLRGMFAFAIWDDERGELFLARDPYGIKPLYYADDGHSFRFASQVKALRAGGSVSAELDAAGVTGFFIWGSVPEPLTIYRAVHLLGAGSTLCVTRAGVKAPSQYWELGESIRRSCRFAEDVAAGSEKDLVRDVLLDSVRAHMVADVPVGAFLSAGLDSSTIVGLAREVSSGPLETITLAFDEFAGRDLDELPIARQIAAHLDVRHHSVRITLSDVEAELSRFLSEMDQPTVDGLNTWLVSKAAAQMGLKVALSGLGGDELLGGYSSFRNIPSQVSRWGPVSGIPLAGDVFRLAYSWLVNPLSSATSKNAGLVKLGGSYEGVYQLQRGLFMPWELCSILDRDFVEDGLSRLREFDQEREELNNDLTPFAKIVVLESSRYMRNQLLRDTDWCGMSHSLEIRVPLVDSFLTEKIVGLAALGRLGEGKAMLGQSLSRPLPLEALARAKTGFTVPIWRWLRKSQELAAWQRIKVLHRKSVHDYCRWAYSIFACMPEATGVLKFS